MKIFSYKNCSALIRNDCINNFRLRSFVSRAPYPPEISKHHHPPPLTETQKKLSAAVQSLEVKVVDLEVYVDPNDHILVKKKNYIPPFWERMYHQVNRIETSLVLKHFPEIIYYIHHKPLIEEIFEMYEDGEFTRERVKRFEADHLYIELTDDHKASDWYKVMDLPRLQKREEEFRESIEMMRDLIKNKAEYSKQKGMKYVLECAESLITLYDKSQERVVEENDEDDEEVDKEEEDKTVPKK